MEGHRVAIEGHLNGARPILLVLKVVHAIGAVTVLTKLALREAVAVELQTVRLVAVARLSRLRVRPSVGATLRSGSGGG